MTSAPSGTVTVLFTDLVGSTALRAKPGDIEIRLLSPRQNLRVWTAPTLGEIYVDL